MTSRQLRKIPRKQERKAKKAEYKASRAAAATTIAPTPTPPLPADINPELLDEFTPEFLAYSNSMRQRIERRVASMKPVMSVARRIESSARPDPGFVSQDPKSEPDSGGFVSQTPCTAEKTRARVM
jgi:hypothetical protein